MSTKLGKSLDEITAGRRQGRRRTTRRAAAKSATVGGVTKNTKAAKTGGKAVHSGLTAAPTESKIMVSGLVSLS